MPEPRSEFLKWVKAKYPRDWQIKSSDPVIFLEWQRETQGKARLESATKWKPPETAEAKAARETAAAQAKQLAEPGFIPPDLVVQVPNLYYSKSTGKWYFEGDGGIVETTPEFAQSYRDTYNRGMIAETPSPTWTTPTPEIFTDPQGNQWIKQTDQNGNVNWKFQGTAPTTGMTDWEKAQVAQSEAAGKRAQEQIDWTKLQGVEATKQAAYNYNQQLVQWRLGGGAAASAEKAELQRQINELQFERDRQTMLNATDVNDWVTRYQLSNIPNKYAKQEVSPIDKLEQDLDSMTGQIQAYKNEAVIATNDLAKAQETGDARIIGEASDRWGVANKIVEDLTERRDNLYKTFKTVQDESINWSPQPVPQPLPNTPTGLSKYVPGLNEGQMISKQFVPTPSGQQLTAMPSDQLKQLGYYGKWTGQLGGKYPWEQLQESASLMQPLTPPGAGRFKVSPARQWV